METDKPKTSHYGVIIAIIFLTVSLIAYYSANRQPNGNQAEVLPENQESSSSLDPASEQSIYQPANQPSEELGEQLLSQADDFSPPLSDALSRVTKKPFGIYISPDNSPVKPERFLGYHTGVDFEVLPEEENTDILVYAICGGPLIEKRNASGYGGIAVQECQFENQMITVIYGHVRLSSISIEAGGVIEAGENFAVLGRGYSPETDDERKHLHLGIHKGVEINIRGYVDSRNQLEDWIDIAEYLK